MRKITVDLLHDLQQTPCRHTIRPIVCFYNFQLTWVPSNMLTHTLVGHNANSLYINTNSFKLQMWFINLMMCTDQLNNKQHKCEANNLLPNFLNVQAIISARNTKSVTGLSYKKCNRVWKFSAICHQTMKTRKETKVFTVA